MNKSNIKNILIITLAITTLAIGYVGIYKKGNQAKDIEKDILVLDIPDATATIEEKQRHFELALSLARATEKIEIEADDEGLCKITPVVFKADATSSFKISSKDGSSHTIAFGPENVYTVPEKEYREISALDLKNGEGLYGFACDSSNKTAGFILLVKGLKNE